MGDVRAEVIDELLSAAHDLNQALQKAIAFPDFIFPSEIKCAREVLEAVGELTYKLQGPIDPDDLAPLGP